MRCDDCEEDKGHFLNAIREYLNGPVVLRLCDQCARTHREREELGVPFDIPTGM